MITTTNEKDRRYHSIDFAKGICILMIIVTHYAWEEPERLRYFFPFWIDMAVPIFMIISGFVYAKSFEKHHIENIGVAYSVRICLSKIIRYTVPFVIAFAIEEIAFNSIGTVDHGILQLGSIFLCGGIGPGSYYYPIMIQFIFYFPIIYFIIRKYDYKGVFICALINVIYEVLKSVYGMKIITF